jgi:hypothetical protein
MALGLLLLLEQHSIGYLAHSLSLMILGYHNVLAMTNRQSNQSISGHLASPKSLHLAIAVNESEDLHS